jgi:hypothetical protein
VIRHSTPGVVVADCWRRNRRLITPRRWDGRARESRGPIRRHLPLILLVVFMAWIVLITVNPDSGGGNPMD